MAPKRDQFAEGMNMKGFRSAVQMKTPYTGPMMKPSHEMAPGSSYNALMPAGQTTPYKKPLKK